MNLFSLFSYFAIWIVTAVFLTYHIGKSRYLSKKVAKAQLETTRFRRHVERLEMVLNQAEPEIFAQVKARSDMEWQQSVKGLDEGELPTFFTLETSFKPIDPLNSGK